MMNSLEPYVSAYGKKNSQLTALNKGFPEQLKKSILQLAVQGKLVPQNPDDEPASALLERIRAEKEHLITEGKIKRDKNESVIFRRDNSHYEKLGSVERCIDDEIPFEIPDSWMWIRFRSIYKLTNGTASRGSVGGIERPVLRLADLSTGSIRLDSVRRIKLTDSEYMSHIVEKDDLIFIRVNGSKDRVATAFRYAENEPVSFCDHLFCGYRLIPASEKYIALIFGSEAIRQQVIPEIKTTAGQNTISQVSMGNVLIPLPPLSEQYRIVEQIGAILPMVKSL